jgi:hypothetical protein
MSAKVNFQQFWNAELLRAGADQPPAFLENCEILFGMAEGLVAEGMRRGFPPTLVAELVVRAACEAASKRGPGGSKDQVKLSVVPLPRADNF